MEKSTLKESTNLVFPLTAEPPTNHQFALYCPLTLWNAPSPELFSKTGEKTPEFAKFPAQPVKSGMNAVPLADSPAVLLDNLKMNVKTCAFPAANAQKDTFSITPTSAFQSNNANACSTANFIKPKVLEFLTATFANVTKGPGSVLKTTVKNPPNAVKTNFTQCAWTQLH
jgi:hypothetical protein